MDFSAKSVAGKLFVSEASLSRFRQKKCGFRGYREFIYQYEENFVVRQDSADRQPQDCAQRLPGTSE